jgi:hypothetical protein
MSEFERIEIIDFLLSNGWELHDSIWRKRINSAIDGCRSYIEVCFEGDPSLTEWLESVVKLRVEGAPISPLTKPQDVGRFVEEFDQALAQIIERFKPLSRDNFQSPGYKRVADAWVYRWGERVEPIQLPIKPSPSEEL